MTKQWMDPIREIWTQHQQWSAGYKAAQPEKFDWSGLQVYHSFNLRCENKTISISNVVRRNWSNSENEILAILLGFWQPLLLQCKLMKKSYFGGASGRHVTLNYTVWPPCQLASKHGAVAGGRKVNNSSNCNTRGCCSFPHFLETVFFFKA